jgi:hypothetical protein
MHGPRPIRFGKRLVLGWLDGIEAELCRSAPRSAHAELARLRSEVRKGPLKRIGRRIDAVIESKPYFRAAYRRHVNRQLAALLPEAESVFRRLCEQLRAAREAMADEGAGK